MDNKPLEQLKKSIEKALEKQDPFAFLEEHEGLTVEEQREFWRRVLNSPAAGELATFALLDLAKNTQTPPPRETGEDVNAASRIMDLHQHIDDNLMPLIRELSRRLAETQYEFVIQIDDNFLEIERSLGAIATGIHDICEAKGWNEKIEERTPGDWVALAHSEISEVLECHRSGHPPHDMWEGEGGKPEGQAVEYIDCLIRILHWFAVHQIDPEVVLIWKLMYNAKRPYRHGNKKL